MTDTLVVTTETRRVPTQDEKDAFLRSINTRGLMKMMDVIRRCGYYDAWVPLAGGGVIQYGFNADELRSVLNTREHVPNKREAKEERRKRAGYRASKKVLQFRH